VTSQDYQGLLILINGYLSNLCTWNVFMSIQCSCWEY